MSWTVEHKPTVAPSIIWTYPTDERSLHRLASTDCPCHPEHEAIPANRHAPVGGVVGGMINHQRMTADQ